MSIALAEAGEAKGGVDAAATLIAAAHELAPKLRERAQQAEALRHVPEETIADYKRAGLIRATQPLRYGGLETGWDTLCDVAQILAAGCGAQAWIQRIMADHAQMVATFPGQAQADVWGQDPDALISASFDPVGRAERVQGGYLLSGRHGFASGIDYASWLICGGFIVDDQRRDGPHFFLVPKSDVTVIDDWETMALAGTGSKSFETTRVFVPAHRFLDGRAAKQGTGPGTALNRSPVYRIPRSSGVTSAGFVALVVGMAEGVLNEWLATTATRKSRGVSIAAQQTTQELVARSSGEIAAADALYRTCLRHALDLVASGGTLTPADRARAKRDMALAAQLCLKAGTRLFNSRGGRGIFLSDALQRQFRHLLGATAHHGLVWDTSAVAYGRVLLEQAGAALASGDE
jgi:3-hydroxy-9,10-secoandrosta-1,3,5(10)-triene-9,17-dione monooxygenase